jgi:hypothetical protein
MAGRCEADVLYRRASASCRFGDQVNSLVLLQRCAALPGGCVIEVDGSVSDDSSAVPLRGTNLEVNMINSRRLDGLKARDSKEAISVAPLRPGATASNIAATVPKGALLFFGGGRRIGTRLPLCSLRGAEA